MESCINELNTRLKIWNTLPTNNKNTAQNLTQDVRTFETKSARTTVGALSSINLEGVLFFYHGCIILIFTKEIVSGI
jgi:hypothetical protein